jgi:Alpha/beta hydrolase domain
LSSGYSQGAAAQLEVITAGLDPSRVYDGHLIQMMGLTCWKREDVAPHFGFFGDCAPLPTNGNHAPVILLASQSDMVIFHPSVLGFGLGAFFTRNPTNHSWRQYEMAAISHLPKPILDLDVPNQHPADARPIFRAAFDNLARWLRGVPPPQAQYFHGGVDGSNAFAPMLDADGNWEGGVRLPHVSSTVLGRRAAAPLGTYEPLNDAGLNPFNPFTLISGTFNRFSDAEILARYRTRQTYVRRIVLAAVSLAERHYITRRRCSARRGGAERAVVGRTARARALEQ